MGVIIFQMISGKLPFVGTNLPALETSVTKGKYTFDRNLPIRSSLC